jgi:hypothetical protein
MMEDLKVEVGLKDGKYPYVDDKNVNLTTIRGVRGRVIYLSSRFVNGNTVTLKRINEFTAMLNNAKIVKTEKGTLVIKHEDGSTLYLIEIPSGYRGSVNVDVVNGDCQISEVLTSPRGSLGEIRHVWCNGDAKLKYKITGRTSTVGYGKLRDLYGENLEGTVIVEEGKVNVVFDEELDKLI